MIKWNTQRMYSKHGQRIVAGILRGYVVFYDIDRRIFGFPQTDKLTQWDIMREYDAGNYDACSPQDVTFQDKEWFINRAKCFVETGTYV